MQQNKSYLNLLLNRCKDISQEELLNMANEVDPDIGTLLFSSFVQKVSFDVIEKNAAIDGKVIPVSRSNFYRRRRRYIQNIEQRLAVAGRA